MFRPLDKRYAGEPAEAELQDLCGSARLDAERIDDPAEAEFAPLVPVGRLRREQMGYGANSTDPYEQARERYHEPEWHW